MWRIHGLPQHEEKRRLIKALEEDTEFRYAVMGLLGFREILDAIMEPRRDQRRLENRFAELKKKFAKPKEKSQN